MTNLIAFLIIAALFVLFAGKKIPVFMRRLARGLRDMKWTDNAYVEVER